MSNYKSNKKDSRPTYVSPRVIRLDDVNSGVGGCGDGNSPAGGIYCVPTGNGAQIDTCSPQGNGAKLSCGGGNGYKP